MVIGVCRVIIHLPNSRSLKGKRGILKGLLEKTRQRFNVSVAEIGLHNDWKQAEVGIGAISNEMVYLHRLFPRIIQYLERWKDIDLLDYTTEYF